MADIRVHVFHTGEVCVASALPFGGAHCSTLKASGVFAKRSERIWLPVSAYLITCPHWKILFDCGWHRDMSPDGSPDRRAQIRSLGSLPLYITNQGRLEKGAAIDEQLAALGINPSELDMVLLSHLDCDHANGLKLVSDAKQILVSGIADDKAAQLRSLEWIRAQSMDANCIESIANHDPDVKPHTIEL